MTYPGNFMTVTMSGTLAGGNEIWSCGFHLSDLLNTKTDWYTWLADGGKAELIAAAAEDFIGSADTKVPFDVLMDEVKFTQRGTDGKTVGEPYIVATNQRGLSNVAYAPQNALVNTLVSAKPRDPGKYNRFYLPISVDGAGGTYKLTETVQVAYLGALHDFVDAVNAITSTEDPDTTVLVSVLSNSGTGYSEPVSYVQLGQIVDTQQRRRNKLNESYLRETVVWA